MTNDEQRELAEWAAGWLGMEEIPVTKGCQYYLGAKNGSPVVQFWSGYAVASVFHSTQTAPILLHLAQEKAEGEGRLILYGGVIGGKRQWSIQKTDSVHTVTARDNNKFIAFWSALRRAVEQKDAEEGKQ